MLWAEQACGLSFNEMDVAGDNSTMSYILGQQQDLYTLFKSLPQNAVSHIISEAQSLDYPITKIEDLTIGDTFKKLYSTKKESKVYLLTDFYPKACSVRCTY